MDYKNYCKTKLDLKLDNWQEKLLNEQGNIVIRAGRQVGKSTAVALKAYFFARENANKTLMIIAASQRQSSLLFEKIISFFIETDQKMIEGEPTKTKLILTNKTRIYCLPAGRTGYAIRGFSIDLMIADEAAFISEPVWVALIPMMAVTGGKLILLSTPFGKGGFFFRCFGDSDYLQFHLRSTDCPRIPKSFISKEKDRMSRLEFAQEYLGEFIEDYTQYFGTNLIRNCVKFLKWNFEEEYDRGKTYYMGVDIARYGGDENAFTIVEMQHNDNLKLVKVLTTRMMSLTDTIGRIIKLDSMFNFRKIFIDDMGLGAGVLDMLIEKLGRKAVGINNSTKTIDKEAEKRIKILKEDLYSNLLVLMERGKIEMIDVPELRRSLQSIQFEYKTESKRVRIYGNYSHIAEALVRAAWSVKAKGLNLYIR